MRITKLGEGVDATGLISKEAIDRVASALIDYRKLMDSHAVKRARVVVTSAGRDAKNAQEFLELVQEITGFVPELLSGEEEGRLSFAGATTGRPKGEGPFAVVDIGGGSTEIALGPVSGPTLVRSLEMGCVRITERFLTHDPPEAKELSRARDHINGLLSSSLPEIIEPRPRTMLGLAGTVSALARLDQGLTSYDRDRIHGYRLTLVACRSWLDILSKEDTSKRRERPTMEAGRAGVIVGGTLVLVAVMEHLGMSECIASEADILDGLIATLL
jgi:exopolyphosphatase/guanosine-5'-triphosphate,3'-diphosphate pyrophosphatase